MNEINTDDLPTTIGTELEQLGNLTENISEIPVFTLQIYHVVILSLFLLLLAIIAFHRYRLNVQKKNQSEHDRIEALKREAIYKKYRLVLRANSTIVWTWNLESKWIDCEFDSFSEDVNYNIYSVSDEVFYSHIHPDDFERIKHAFEILKAGEISILQEEFRYRLVNSPDEYNWVESFAIVGDVDPEGHPTSLVGGTIITTERKRLEKEAKKKEQAEEANRMKSAFLASVRHEIRTPLNAILGFSDLIVQGCESKEAIEYGEIVRTNSDLLLELIDDVLELSEIESGQMEFKESWTDVSEILLIMNASYRGKTQKGVRLATDLPAQSFFAHIDINWVTKVLKQFLSNACKFTSSGTITLGFKPVDKGLYFYVSDTGVGIAKENLPHVFERFAKFDSFIQGIGLGLSVSQTIVSKMNGEIGIASEVGEGSTFWFTLPCDISTTLDIS